MVDLRSLLFGNKLRIAAVAVGALALLLGGAVATGVLGAPSVTGIDNRFGDVNETTTVIESDLHVSNRNPIGAEFGGETVTYEVSMNGIVMAHGAREGVSVPRGDSTIPLTTHLSNDRIPPWWVSHIRNDEATTLRVDASIHSGLLNRSFGAPPVEREIETDLIGEFNSEETRPVNASNPAVSDPVLYVNETRAEWGEVNGSATPIPMAFEMYNPKTAPVVLTEIGYTIAMNDVVVGEGATDRNYVIEPKTSETVETTTLMDNAELDDWWVTHLEREQTTDLRIEFHAKVRVAGTTVRLPMDELTYTERIETDIFGTKNETAESGADAGSTGEGPNGTTTATPTADGDAGTATPTPTETPDDGLFDDGTETATPADTPESAATPTETSTPTGNETTTNDGILS